MTWNKKYKEQKEKRKGKNYYCKTQCTIIFFKEQTGLDKR